jgi:Protein of unknown function (DUF3995)
MASPPRVRSRQTVGTCRASAPGQLLLPLAPGDRLGGWAARAALVVALAYAAISAYWALGGTWLLTTVGASLTTNHRSIMLTSVVWAAVALKAAGALVPLLACLPPRRSTWHPVLRVCAWAEGALIALYGFVFTSVELMAEVGMIHPGKTTDRRALAWHAYLWDPWFLIWGLLVITALLLTRAAVGTPDAGPQPGGRPKWGITPDSRPE